MKSISGIVAMAAVVFGMSGCETSQSEDAAIWNKPPRYGHGGSQNAADAGDGQEKKNRFGFGGDASATAQADNPAGNQVAADGGTTTDGSLGSTSGANSDTTASDKKGKMDDKKDGKSKKGAGGSKSSPPPSLKSYPFGKPVPGKSGFVTLASPHDGLGEIDVRGIAPGTPVEIPDPTKPGIKIYFRVP